MISWETAQFLIVTGFAVIGYLLKRWADARLSEVDERNTQTTVKLREQEVRLEEIRSQAASENKTLEMIVMLAGSVNELARALPEALGRHSQEIAAESQADREAFNRAWDQTNTAMGALSEGIDSLTQQINQRLDCMASEIVEKLAGRSTTAIVEAVQQICNDTQQAVTSELEKVAKQVIAHNQQVIIPVLTKAPDSNERQIVAEEKSHA